MDKICRRCKEPKAPSFFSVDKSKQDGLQSACQACNRSYYLANKQRIAEREREYYQLHREEKVAYAKKYYETNKQIIREKQKLYEATVSGMRLTYARKWRSENRDWTRAYMVEYRAIHKARFRDYDSRRRELLRSEVPIEPEYIRILMSLSCYVCESTSKHLDHISPLSRGGVHELLNLAPACAFCNQSKGSKLLSEWAPESEVQLWESAFSRQNQALLELELRPL